MKVRVFYRPDGTVAVMQLVEKARKPRETDTEMFDRCTAKIPSLQGLDYTDINHTQLPPRDKNRNKWRGRKGLGIWIDHSVVTIQERMDQINQEIDQELAKPSPNPIKLIRLQREKEILV